MYKAVRAFVRFGRYPETRPYRWRAFKMQTIRWWVTLAHLLALSPLIATVLILWPFAWLHEKLEARNFWWPLDGLLERTTERWLEEHRFLNPIYLRASKAHTPPQDRPAGKETP